MELDLDSAKVTEMMESLDKRSYVDKVLSYPDISGSDRYPDPAGSNKYGYGAALLFRMPMVNMDCLVLTGNCWQFRWSNHLAV